MKKVVALLMVCALSLALFGCGKATGNKGGDDTTKAAAQPADDGDSTSAGADDVKFSQKGDKTVFTVDSGIALQQDAWLGFCPGTKGFVKEMDADEFDVLYAYTTEDENNNGGDYIFEFDNDSIDALDDGDYILVLCDSDDENVGKVVLYIPAKLDGAKVTLNYDKLVVNK